MALYAMLRAAFPPPCALCPVAGAHIGAPLRLRFVLAVGADLRVGPPGDVGIDPYNRRAGTEPRPYRTANDLHLS